MFRSTNVVKNQIYNIVQGANTLVNILIPDFAFLLYFCSMIRFGSGRFGKNHICTYTFQYLHFFF